MCVQCFHVTKAIRHICMAFLLQKLLVICLQCFHVTKALYSVSAIRGGSQQSFSGEAIVGHIVLSCYKSYQTHNMCVQCFHVTKAIRHNVSIVLSCYKSYYNMCVQCFHVTKAIRHISVQCFLVTKAIRHLMCLQCFHVTKAIRHIICVYSAFILQKLLDTYVCM